MLEEVKYVHNVGRFGTARSISGARFGRCTLVFGENGWGKSTLADILRSLSTSNSDILIGRKTLDSTNTQKVVLRVDGQDTVYENDQWRGSQPFVVIYDNSFINNNVYSGDLVSGEHLKRQFGLVVGEEGVNRVRRILELDEENRRINTEIKNTESQIAAEFAPIAPSSMKMEEFLSLELHENADDSIADLESQIGQLKRAKELKAASEPNLYPSPTEAEELRNLLSFSIDDVAQDAHDRVRAHIKEHDNAPGGHDLALETWLEKGMAFPQDEDCPYCGQALTDRSLVDTYKDIFSSAYKEHSTAIQRARETCARYVKGDFRNAVKGTNEQNGIVIGYWSEASQLGAPDIKEIEPLIDSMEKAAKDLDALFAKKQTNLTSGIDHESSEAALTQWNESRQAYLDINLSLTQYLGKISELKKSLDQSKLPDLENSLRMLNATKVRHEPKAASLAATLNELRQRKVDIAAEKKQVRTELDAHGRAITSDLGQSINSYLRRLNAGFRIDYKEPDYRGKEPSASYNIIINEVPISPKSSGDQLSQPSFRNTLSSGDKSTLALAFFLAKLNSYADLSNAIVVLDDPFTSLDDFRRQFTAFEIRDICSKARQTIVLSHEKSFLRLLWDKIDHGIISALALQTGAPGISTIANFDIEAATQPRNVTERARIQEFLEGEAHEPSYIRSRLRTVCEDFYRSGDRNLFGEAANLEEVIRLLDTAPDDHPYKSALGDLRGINEYSRADHHAEVAGNPSEETTVEELKEFCRRILELTSGM